VLDGEIKLPVKDCIELASNEISQRDKVNVADIDCREKE
jgi:hypothetical protein